jgi:beta-glucosidase
MIKRILRIIGYSITSIILMLLVVLLIYTINSRRSTSAYMAKLGPEAPILYDNGVAYRDLNKNGIKDIYESVEAPIDERVDDLISQMTIEEKAGTLFINMIGVHPDGGLMEHPVLSDPFSLLMAPTTEMVIGKHMNHFNIRAAYPKEVMLNWYNAIQKMGERSRLGIPITIASDPRHGVPSTFGASIYTPFFSKWPSALGFGAIGDSTLVAKHAEIVRKEYTAIGIKVALGPMADVATEPRWTRINGTFGEDASLNAKLTSAYIKGLQGDSIDANSVLAMVKHFPGSGPLDDGKDSHFPPGTQSYKGGQFNYHLKPFEAAFEAGAGSVMPYYSVPNGITSENVAAAYNREIITDLLREEYQFNGVVCTDWGIVSDIKLLGLLFKPASAHGVEELSIEERLVKIIDAGVDMIGGESLYIEMKNVLENKLISEERIDTSLRRILRDKFRLGLFDNPYLNEDNLKIYSNNEHLELGLEAQRKSIVLLKNEGQILPLPKEKKIHLYGFYTEMVSGFNTVSLEEADIVVVKVQTPKGEGVDAESLMQKLLEGGRLDYTPDQLNELLPILKSKPSILVANLQRPAVLTEMDEVAKAVIADFDVSESLILDLIFGTFSPSGKLPIQLPSSMQSVYEQIEDVPFDSANALYEFGHGLSYD